MKKLVFVVSGILIGAATFAQVKKHIPAKPKPDMQLLKTHIDSVSYAAGMNQVRMLKSLHTTFNLNKIDKAIADSLTKKKTLLNIRQAEGLLEAVSKRKLTDSSKVEYVAANTGDALKLLSPADSLSYAFGLYVAGTFTADYGIDALKFKIFNTAIENGLNNKPLLLTTLESRKVLADIYRPEFFKNLEASKKFLEANKKLPGVITLPDGLQYKVLKQGTGANVMMGDSVAANYKGTLIDGKQFDSSYDRGQPLKLTDITRVISGWTEGLQLMNLGAKYRFFIPPNLAYGSRQRSDIIAPYSALIFDVEVVKINNR